MPRIRKKDADRKRKLLNWFKSKEGQKSLKNVQEDAMVDPYGRPINVMLPEAEVSTLGNKDRDLSKDVLLGLREAAGMVPILGEGLDAAELSNIVKTGKDFYGDEADPKMYAGMTAAGLLVPNLIERPVKGGLKLLKKAGQKLGNKMRSVKFASEINWGDWNPEIPKNKSLVREYNDIEKTTKRDGTWMKNPDGTDFDGSPEQFVQTQSKAFKEAFPEGYDKLYRGVKNETEKGITRSGRRQDLENAPTFYSEDASQASQYSTDAEGNIPFRGAVNPQRITPQNIDDIQSGLFELAYPSEADKIAMNTAGSNWMKVQKTGPEEISKAEEVLANINKALKDGPREKVQLSSGSYETIDGISVKKLESKKKEQEELLKFMKSPRDVSSDDELLEFFSRFNEWKAANGRSGVKTDSDDFAAFLSENPDVNRIVLRGLDDEALGDVNILSNASGVNPKSLIGNRGTFDLSDPDVFKALVPIIGSSAAIKMARDQGVSSPGEKMKYGGKFKVKKKAQEGMKLKKSNGDPPKGYKRDADGYLTPVDFNEFHEMPSDSLNVDAIKKGISMAESIGGVLMMNPTSTATGMYGQRYSEIKDLPFMKGISREEFAKDLPLQEKVFEMRMDEGIGGPSIRRNVMELTEEYAPQLGDDWNFSPDDVAFLSNFIGRQGTRKYFASLRDGTKFSVPGTNKTVDEYLKIARGAAYED